MKILVITNLYPPHHAGTFDYRCSVTTETLAKRGHTMKVLTSNYGVKTEQRDEEIERRLWLNGIYDKPAVTSYRELSELELHNNAAMQETIAEYEPELIHVWSLYGLSKSLIFGLRNTQLPVVYHVADYWMAQDIQNDPWLRWWNAPGTNLTRASLELTGQRNKFDKAAPTRMMKGYDRLPNVYGAEAKHETIAQDTVGGFLFNRLYFSSLTLKQAVVNRGFRVTHADVIYPGIPAGDFIGEIKPTSAPIKRFLIATRLTPESGVITVLKALQQARANGLNFTLSIYGRGDSDYVAQLRSFAVRASLPVEFLTVSNNAKDLPAVYRQHDAFIHSTEWEEPFASTPLEAMACGLPVIATNCGGIREFMRHGENALIYAAGNEVELASRMHELQLQPALRIQMAETAQAEVLSKYNDSVVIDQIENYLAVSLEGWQHA